jgi:PAS domain S-box-containing protein
MSSIFLAEVVAMIVVYLLAPMPYEIIVFIDASLMTLLIFPVLYYFSFRPLIRQMEKSWQAEESLLQSRVLQERFFDSIDTLIAYLDRDFNFIRVNDAYAKAGGHTPDYFMGRNHFDLFSHAENQTIFQQVVETGEAFSVAERPFVYPDYPERGTTYWNWSLAPVKGSDGAVEGLVLSLLDVTARRRAQDQIHQLSRIVEQTDDTVVVTDCDGVIEYVNPAFERLTGYLKTEVLGKTPRILKSGVHHIDFYQELWNTILNGSVFQSEIVNRKKNGALFYEVKTVTPLRDAQGNITNFVATGKDITEHKRAEKDLRERNQREQILTQTIHTMQLDIARDLHDTLGQNISFLRMKLDYLAEKKIRKQAEMQREIQGMARAANDSYDLMRGTLAVLQSEGPTDLFHLFTRYAEQIEERAAFKVKFSSQGESRFMSARRMRQLFYIFREILNNIEKHANASEVSMNMAWDRDCFQLVVQDNGDGFDMDNIQYGDHYGLKFMRDRAELLNGSLAIQSSVGSGTYIMFQAPYE